jgi:hypothetical protein
MDPEAVKSFPEQEAIPTTPQADKDGSVPAELLVVIAFRKACNQMKHEARRQPRDGRGTGQGHLGKIG